MNLPMVGTKIKIGLLDKSAIILSLDILKQLIHIEANKKKQKTKKKPNITFGRHTSFDIFLI
jgi:hypothetical protein